MMTMDKFWLEKLTWAFGTGELKNNIMVTFKINCETAIKSAKERAGLAVPGELNTGHAGG